MPHVDPYMTAFDFSFTDDKVLSAPPLSMFDPSPATTFEFLDPTSRRRIKAANRSALLEFANKVREAGGGTPLAALMPALPANAHQCLIARSLNFSCAVRPEPAYPRERFPSGAERWIMDVEPEEKAVEIAKGAGLDLRYNEPLGRLVLLLPEEIGNAAHAFDHKVPEFAGLTEAY